MMSVYGREWGTWRQVVASALHGTRKVLASANTSAPRSADKGDFTDT
jgi:hypothetical protein